MGRLIFTRYQGSKATFTMVGDLRDGGLPPKQAKYVAAWVAMHEDELLTDWELVQEHAELFRIDSLK